MRYFFSTISIIMEHMLRLLIYQVSLLYDNFINKAFILSMFLYFRYFYINTKLRLLKNIVIDFFVILLTYINFVHLYSTLFLNKRQLFILPSIFTTFFIAFLSCISFLAWFFLPFLNLINLNSL